MNKPIQKPRPYIGSSVARITDEQMRNHYKNDVYKDVVLWQLDIEALGSKQYGIYVAYGGLDSGGFNNKHITTTNTQVIDAWTSRYNFEPGTAGFDNWDQVIQSILTVIDI